MGCVAPGEKKTIYMVEEWFRAKETTLSTCLMK
jgi:hypothetical protein